ncbi:hypothetical protein NDU88_000438 [Pleurodeles waltl]|uniref:Uncharacterized protein n=1 Tax=Pleurodeles waltl TaxID=8319 RepID=A0AAV7N7Y6_PLEWA|nr:hypothetical protein NDU88_000438 [Pleurodeles waltl]
MAGLGNPDIRVSQGVEKEEGQNAREEEKKDEAVGEDGDADGRDSAGKNIPEDGRLDKQSLSKPRVITSLFRACALAPSPSFHLQARVRPWVVSPAAHEAPFPVITRKNAQEKRATGNHKNKRNSK